MPGSYVFIIAGRQSCRTAIYLTLNKDAVLVADLRCEVMCTWLFTTRRVFLMFKVDEAKRFFNSALFFFQQVNDSCHSHIPI